MEGNKKMNKTWNLKEMKKLIPLALPVLVVNLSIVGMGAVDAIVAGRAGVTDMAAVALGSSVYLPVALFACGVLMIIGPVIANMRGKSHESRVGYMTNHGLWLALMLSLVSMPVIYVLRNVFGWISDDAAMCRMASAYMFAIMWGLPANLGFVALKSLNEGSNMTRPAMYVGLCGLLLNIPLNYMFVFGMYGFPRMGGAGCGAATAVIFYIEFLLMFLLVYFNPKHRPYRRHIISWRRPTPSVITGSFGRSDRRFPAVRGDALLRGGSGAGSAGRDSGGEPPDCRERGRPGVHAPALRRAGGFHPRGVPSRQE